MPHHAVRQSTRRNARQLRSDMTTVETQLWRVIRAHRLEGISFRRQLPISGYIVDFAAPALRLVLELDGSQHGEAAGLQKDQQRDQLLQSLGWTVMRIWNVDVLQDLDGVCRRILAHAEMVGRKG